LDVAEFGDELVEGFVGEGGGGGVGWEGGEVVAVGGAELEFDVCVVLLLATPLAVLGLSL